MLGQEGATVFRLCKFPFLLSVRAKDRLLRAENREQMVRRHGTERLGKAEGNRRRGWQATSALRGAMVGASPVLVLEVRRAHLLADTLAQLATWSHDRHLLRRPLKIKFTGELGVDEGGLLKEYFMLLLPLLYEKAFAPRGKAVRGPVGRRVMLPRAVIPLSFPSLGDVDSVVPARAVGARQRRRFVAVQSGRSAHGLGRLQLGAGPRRVPQVRRRLGASLVFLPPPQCAFAGPSFLLGSLLYQYLLQPHDIFDVPLDDLKQVYPVGLPGRFDCCVDWWLTIAGAGGHAAGRG